MATRYLVIATAGHVDHGKSTFVRHLTGKDPDRLPQEKARGMTLDLGFVHADGLSVIDCPGHEGFLRHMIAGVSAVDGVCLIVSLAEGPQEQTFEHLRILKWLGIKDILLVLTKADLLKDQSEVESRAESITKNIRQHASESQRIKTALFSPAFSRETLTHEVKTFFSPAKVPKLATQPRFFIDRAFVINGVGTVVTGTFSEGHLKLPSSGVLWTPGRANLQKISIRSIRLDTVSADECTQLARVALHIDGISAAEIKRGSILLWGDNDRELVATADLNLEWCSKTKTQFEALMQVGTLSLETRLRRHPKGSWRAHFEAPAPLSAGDHILIRVPNRIKGVGHTIAGGRILAAPSLPAHRKAGVILSLTKPVETKITPDSLVLQKLELTIRERKWDAMITPKEKDAAHQLAKARKIIHVGELHFLHNDHNEDLKRFLNDHFANHTHLSIDHAREFFQTGRKRIIEILEYCDRMHWTFRKGIERKPFKLPSCPRPSAFLPSDERACEKPTDHPL